MTRQTREIPFSQIQQTFTLSSYWFGRTWCPAVEKRDDGTYQIRVEVGRRGDVTKWDYFELAEDGTVEMAPRGYARDYKPGRITGLDEAVAEYATDPDARRFVLPGGAS